MSNNDIERARLLEYAVESAVGGLSREEWLELRRQVGAAALDQDDGLEQAAAAIELARQPKLEPMPRHVAAAVAGDADRYFAPRRVPAAVPPRRGAAGLVRLRRLDRGGGEFRRGGRAGAARIVRRPHRDAGTDGGGERQRRRAARPRGRDPDASAGPGAGTAADAGGATARGRQRWPGGVSGGAGSERRRRCRARIAGSARSGRRSRRSVSCCSATGHRPVIPSAARSRATWSGTRARRPATCASSVCAATTRRASSTSSGSSTGVATSAIPVDGGVFDVRGDGDEVIVPIRASLPVGSPLAFAVTIERPGGVVVSDRSRVVVIARVG